VTNPVSLPFPYDRYILLELLSYAPTNTTGMTQLEVCAQHFISAYKHILALSVSTVPDVQENKL